MIRGDSLGRMVMKIVSKPLLSYIVIIFVGIIVYANSFGVPFHFDEYEYIVNNPFARDIPFLLENWEEYRRKFLTLFSFAVNYYFHGHDTFGYHLVNLCLHLGNTLLFWGVLRTLLLSPQLSKSNIAKQKDLFAFFSALIFLVHPIQTQAVTYIWQRSEILSAFFYLSSYYLYLSARFHKRKSLYFGTLVLFFAGFFAKGTVVTLPLLILLTEIYFFYPKESTRFLKRQWPYLGLIFMTGVLFFKEAMAVLRIILTPMNLSPMVGFFPRISFDYLFTQFTVMMQYIKLSFLPVNQNVDYYWPLYTSFFYTPVILSFLILICIFLMAVKLFNKYRLLSFGIFWFFIYLLPTSSIVALDPIWEHRLYLSIAGFSMFFVGLIFEYFSQARTQKLALIVVVCVFSVLTITRNRVWASPIALMEDTIKKSQLNPRPHFVLGTLYQQKGDVRQAGALYRKAIELNPKYAHAYNNLATIYMDRGQIHDAEILLKKAKELTDEYYKYYFTLPYINLAYIEMSRGNFKKADEYFQKGKSHTTMDKVYLGLARLAKAQRDYKQSIIHLNTAIRFSPDNASLYLELGNVFSLQKKNQEALSMYQKSIALNPNNCDAHMGMGVVYFFMKDYHNSISAFKKAMSIDPKRAGIYRNLADVYAALGDYDLANEYDKKAKIPYARGGRFEFLY